MASALYTGLMLLPTLFVYTEPPRPENTKTLKQVLHRRRRGARRLTLHADDRRLLGLLDSLLPELRHHPLVPARLHRQGAGRRGHQRPARRHGHDVQVRRGTRHRHQRRARSSSCRCFVSRIVKNLPALPTMVTGMLFGAVGFLLLALSQNAWIFILGIAVFSIGEMTAHPKYYSFVGLVAPQDRKAVYMGYAFLYGVFGSLLGSSIGAYLYTEIMKPAIGMADAATTTRNFWLMFAALDVVAAVGLILFARRVHRRHARDEPPGAHDHGGGVRGDLPARRRGSAYNAFTCDARAVPHCGAVDHLPRAGRRRPAVTLTIPGSGQIRRRPLGLTVLKSTRGVTDDSFVSCATRGALFVPTPADCARRSRCSRAAAGGADARRPRATSSWSAAAACPMSSCSGPSPWPAGPPRRSSSCRRPPNRPTPVTSR